MKIISRIILLLCIIATDNIKSQAINFNDAKFEAALKSKNIDKNGDGLIQISEAALVDSLIIPALEIKSLDGIQHFSNLIYLDCSFNQLSLIDLSQNTKLKKLKSTHNQITKLDVTTLEDLVLIDCKYNQLTEMFFYDLPNLVFLDFSYNPILVDKPFNNTKLYHLNCSASRKSGYPLFDFSQLTNLEELYTTYNNLSELNLIDNAKLKILNCDYNMISDLKLSDNKNLEKLYCSENLLTRLDVTSLEKLQTLKFNFNKVESIDVKNCKDLKQLAFIENYISTLDLSNNLNLRLLSTRNNKLTEIDMSNLTEMIFIDITDNRISEIDISQMDNLEELHCGTNRLLELLIVDKPKLTIVFCEYNFIQNFKITNCPNIKELNVSYNSLVELDLGSISFLKKIKCNSNSIVNLININTDSLEILHCHRNDISDLDLGAIPFLKEIIIWNNKVKKLEFSQADSLFYIDLGSNLFNEFSFPECPNLESVNLGRSPLKYIDVSNCPKLNKLNIYYTDVKMLNLSSNKYIETLYIDSELEYLNLSNGSNNSNLDLGIYNGDSNIKFICVDKEELEGIKKLFEDKNDGPEQFTMLVDCAFPELTGSLTSYLTGSIPFSNEENDCNESEGKIKNITFDIGNENSPIKKVIPYYNAMNNYEVLLPEGHYELYPEHLNGFNFRFSPTSASVDITDTQVAYQDFCASPLARERTEFKVTLIPLTHARPGFVADYKLLIQNIGNVAAKGSTYLDYDNSIMDYIGPNSDIQDKNGRIIFEFDELIPTHEVSTIISFKLNTPQDTPPLNGGDKLCFFLRTYLESELVNHPNEELKAAPDYCQNVINSYDPNDKTLLSGPFLLDTLINDYLTYLIRFENTGTASAINVVVEDDIDPDAFIISSLRIVDSSHPMKSLVKGNKISFIFEDINLPFDDENNDGYVAFEIKPKPDLEVGDILANEAFIYFDFNYPIITNTSIAELVTDMDNDGYHNGIDCDDNDIFINPSAIDISGNGIDEDCDGEDTKPVLINEGNVILYPNPVSDIMTIQTNPLINYHATLYSFDGIKLWDKLRPKQIDFSIYPAGTYFLYIDDLNSGKRKLKKVVVLR